MAKDVIIACDFSSKEQTLSFLDKFTGRKPFVKIGMELFYAITLNLCSLTCVSVMVGKSLHFYASSAL